MLEFYEITGFIGVLADDQGGQEFIMGHDKLKIIVILMTLFKILLILNLFVFQIEENLFFFPRTIFKLYPHKQ